MTGLKWFAGGKERREQAVAIIDEVIETIGDKPDYADLKQVLHSYRTELSELSFSHSLYLKQDVTGNIRSGQKEPANLVSLYRGANGRVAKIASDSLWLLYVIREVFLGFKVELSSEKRKMGQKGSFPIC